MREVKSGAPSPFHWATEAARTLPDEKPAGAEMHQLGVFVPGRERRGEAAPGGIRQPDT